MTRHLCSAFSPGERLWKDDAIVAGEPDDVGLELSRFVDQQLIAALDIGIERGRQPSHHTGCDFSGRQTFAVNRSLQLCDIAIAEGGQVTPEYIDLIAGGAHGAFPKVLSHAAREERRHPMIGTCADILL